jgi:Family of unknown function (DUF695)
MSEGFWTWWATAKDRLDAAIRGGQGIEEELVEEISRQVEAIAPGGLAWELTPGRRAAHALVVTAAGDPELRAAAERWRRSAPEPDGTWEYLSARPASLDAFGDEFEFGGRRIDMGDVSIAYETDERRREVDVRVHHPAFAAADEGFRGQLTFLVLDWVLGEEDVERYVGAVEPVDARPADARPVEELRDAVAPLREGEGDWVLLEGRAQDGTRAIVSAMARLKPVDHPLLDTHAEVAFGYESDHPEGLADGAELERLRSLEDELEGALGDDGLMVAHMTAAGTRVFHCYLDGESDAGRRVQDWASARDGEVSVTRDPAWDGVERFR